MAVTSPSRSSISTYTAPITYPFWACHGIALFGVIFTGWSWSGLALALILYYVRMFFVTAGLHRYMSHRAFKTSRAFQFILALGGTMAAQKGALWWAAHHRHHHKFSDLPGDLHSAKLDGFWWSHIGWITARDYEDTQWDKIRDLARFPELRFLNTFHLLPPLALAVTLALLGGWHALLWGFFVSTVLLWHGTFTINSLSHVFGSRRYNTTDDSKNNALLAIITMGEGWHNNHHHYMTSANQGFFWYEIDMSYYILKVLSWFGIVYDLRKPPARVLKNQTAPAERPVSAFDNPVAEANTVG